MWIKTNTSFVSIVQHRDDPDVLLVRGRFKGDAARFMGLPASEEIETPSADYRFRVIVSREHVGRRLAVALKGVDYPNFKDSIRTAWRKSVASRIWSILFHAQEERLGGKSRGVAGFF